MRNFEWRFFRFFPIYNGRTRFIDELSNSSRLAEWTRSVNRPCGRTEPEQTVNATCFSFTDEP